jgi:hypothetical protein
MKVLILFEKIVHKLLEIPIALFIIFPIAKILKAYNIIEDWKHERARQRSRKHSR